MEWSPESEVAEAADVELNFLVPGIMALSGSVREWRTPGVEGPVTEAGTQPRPASSEVMSSLMVASSSNVPWSMSALARFPKGVCCAM